MGNHPSNDKKQRKKLYRNAIAKKYSVVEEIIHSGYDISQEFSLLELATRKNNVVLVKLLLENGCIPHKRSECKALDIGIVLSRNEIVSTLLELDIPYNDRNQFGETLMHICACRNCDWVIDRLVCKGLDLNEKTREWTPLHVAAQRRNTNALKALIRNGADLDVLNKDGYTAVELSIAVTHTSSEVWDVYFLIQGGCLLDHRKLHSEDYIQLQFQRNPKLKELVTNSMTSVKTLRDICRLRLRTCLGQGILFKVRQLPLPLLLKDFICMANVLEAGPDVKSKYMQPWALDIPW